MFKIAICDDEPVSLEQAAALGQDYLKNRPSFEGRLSLFESGQALLETVEGNGGFDLYLLDVLMPELNGIEVGKQLRTKVEDGTIIYLTASPDYAVDSYLTKAFFYLLKPVNREQFFDVLDQAVAVWQKQKKNVTIIHTPNGLRALPRNDILYLERVARSIRYYMADGETVDSRTLRGAFGEAAAPLLEDPRFVLCGASFALNLSRVKAVERREALLDSGTRISMPRTACEKVKKAWMDYWLGGAEP